MVNSRRFFGLAATMVLVASGSIWAADLNVVQHTLIQNDHLEAVAYKIVQTPGYPPPPPQEAFFKRALMNDTGGNFNYIYAVKLSSPDLLLGQECKVYVNRKDAAGKYTIPVSTLTLYAQ